MLESVITRSKPAFSIGFSFGWTFGFGEVFCRGSGFPLYLRAIEFEIFEIRIQNYPREENYGQLELKKVVTLEMNLLGSSRKSFSHTHVFKFPKKCIIL